MSCKTFQRFWHILTWEIAYYSFLSDPNVDNKIPRRILQARKLDLSTSSDYNLEINDFVIWKC